MLVVVDRGLGGVIGGRMTLSYGAKTCSTPLQIDPSKLQQGKQPVEKIVKTFHLCNPFLIHPCGTCSKPKILRISMTLSLSTME